MLVDGTITRPMKTGKFSQHRSPGTKFNRLTQCVDQAFAAVLSLSALALF